MMIRSHVLALACVGLGLTRSALAQPEANLSRRDRLYDIAQQGDALFVVGHPGHLLRSRDGGESWQALDGGQGDQALFAIDFNSKGRGAIVGRSGMFLLSEDGGATWSSSLITLEEDHPGMFGVEVLEDGTIIAVGEFGMIARSEDGGKTFSRVVYTTGAESDDDDWDDWGDDDDADDDEEEEAADAEAEDGTAESAAGVQAEEPATPRNPACPDLDEVAEANYDVIDEARLADVMFVDDSRGFVVGEFGMMLQTTDGGRSFARIDGCSANMLYNLGQGPGRLVAVGFAGTVVESVDGGKTWAPRPSGTEEDLYSVSVSGETLLVTGAVGTVRRASGAGPFERVESGVFTWLVSSWLGEERALVVGGRAVMLRSDDGGKSLTRLEGVTRD